MVAACRVWRIEKGALPPGVRLVDGDESGLTFHPPFTKTTSLPMKHAACVGHTNKESLPEHLSNPRAATLEAHSVHTFLQLALSHTHTSAHTGAPDTKLCAYAFVMPLEPKPSRMAMPILLGCHSQLVTMSKDCRRQHTCMHKDNT
jgi:hypothetical protein